MSIAGDVAVVAIGAVIAALLLAPAPKTAAGASPKPAAKPSPRIRIDCESVLDRATVDAYLGTPATLMWDSPTWIERVPFLQRGGLGCTWTGHETSLRVTALPVDVIPDGMRYFRTDPQDDASPLAGPTAPTVECIGDGCMAMAATDQVAIVVEHRVADPDWEQRFRVIAGDAISAIAAVTRVESPWTPPYPLTMTAAADCEHIDPDAVLAAVAVGGRWAFDSLVGGIVGRSGTRIDVPGAEGAVAETPATLGYGAVTILCRDSIIQFTSDRDLDGAALERAASAWAGRYCG